MYKHKITQKEFDNLPTNKQGGVIVPTNCDLTSIRDFPSYSTFAEGCIFGNRIVFGDYCKVERFFTLKGADIHLGVGCEHQFNDGCWYTMDECSLIKKY